MEKLDINSFFYGWTIVKSIGRGGYGEVYEIQRSSLGETEKAALKVLHIPNDPTVIQDMRSEGYDDESIKQRMKADLRSFSNEYKSMRNLVHANIVNCDDMQYEADENGLGYTVYIKMELLTPLVEELKGTYDPNAVASKLGKDICKALDLCEERNIVHRDIKPQNLFVDSYGNYKLGDFGIARQMDHTTHATKTGTYKYMAPEVYRGEKYYHEVDIYSLGLVMYWLLNEKRMPFVPLPPTVPTAQEEETAKHKRLKGEKIPAPKYGSAGLKKIVLKACEADRRKRYQSAAEMLADLEALGKRRKASGTNAPTDTMQKKQNAYDDSVDTGGWDDDASTAGYNTSRNTAGTDRGYHTSEKTTSRYNNESTRGNSWNDDDETVASKVQSGNNTSYTARGTSYTSSPSDYSTTNNHDETVGAAKFGSNGRNTSMPQQMNSFESQSIPPANNASSGNTLTKITGFVFWLAAIIAIIGIGGVTIYAFANGENPISSTDSLFGIQGLRYFLGLAIVLVSVIAIKTRHSWPNWMQAVVATAIIIVFAILIVNNDNNSDTAVDVSDSIEVLDSYGGYDNVGVIQNTTQADWLYGDLDYHISGSTFSKYLLKDFVIASELTEVTDTKQLYNYFFTVKKNEKNYTIFLFEPELQEKVRGLGVGSKCSFLCKISGTKNNDDKLIYFVCLVGVYN